MPVADQLQDDKTVHRKKKVGKSLNQKKNQKDTAHDDSEEEVEDESIFLIPTLGEVSNSFYLVSATKASSTRPHQLGFIN